MINNDFKYITDFHNSLVEILFYKISFLGYYLRLTKVTGMPTSNDNNSVKINMIN